MSLDVHNSSNIEIFANFGFRKKNYEETFLDKIAIKKFCLQLFVVSMLG